MTLADGPIAMIRPLVTTIVACSMGALPVPSITRAPVNAIRPGAGTCARSGAAIRTIATAAHATHVHHLRTSNLLFHFSTFPLFHFSSLTPSWLFVGADAERDLADDFVREQRVGRMEPAGARVAEQPLELALLEHAEAARQIERAIRHAERALQPTLCFIATDLEEPVRADAPFRPVAARRFDVRPIASMSIVISAIPCCISGW